MKNKGIGNQTPLETKPLEGLLVVSVEQAVAAPLSTARLADAGARVIKIERPGGDFARGYDKAAHGDSSYFVWTNHGKESVELDFKNEQGAQLLHSLISQADVFVQNLAPGAMSRAGFDSAKMRQKHPRLITCDISGYGYGDAVKGLKAYDLLVQAESGLVSISGSPGELGRIGVSLCDIGAGVTAHAGILEALIGRGITGKGSGISVSLFDVAAEWMSVPLIHSETGEGSPVRVGLKHPSIAPYGAFPCSDGTLTLISVQNEREWLRLCESVLKVPGLAIDKRFNSNVNRVTHRDDCDSAIAAVTSTLTSHEFRQALNASSIAYGALNSVADLSKHIALRRRSVRNSDDHMLSLPAHPVIKDGLNSVDNSFSESTATQKFAANSDRRVPRAGQHTAAVAEEFGLLGWDA